MQPTSRTDRARVQEFEPLKIYKFSTTPLQECIVHIVDEIHTIPDANNCELPHIGSDAMHASGQRRAQNKLTPRFYYRDMLAMASPVFLLLLREDHFYVKGLL